MNWIFTGVTVCCSCEVNAFSAINSVINVLLFFSCMLACLLVRSFTCSWTCTYTYIKHHTLTLRISNLTRLITNISLEQPLVEKNPTATRVKAISVNRSEPNTVWTQAIYWMLGLYLSVWVCVSDVVGVCAPTTRNVAAAIAMTEATTSTLE